MTIQEFVENKEQEITEIEKEFDISEEEEMSVTTVSTFEFSDKLKEIKS